ncbi:diguanylate cyclase/phosphodiesterase with PAS/PAC sensor(s) [Hydrogenobaculum sp. Y04AAS1]|uniref:EAL domain-containing protein n=1 Tax=Hydrogenobaculum sp. (strain Y04AAS1) TaxID=380749 RepID=UPI00015BD314|nr:diguanylate cyclase/phosphodiesterase with PAS/PAC sensor(s) [Hydrogenobaculum sp. Y04AAS1]HCT67160.1 GGDEF domain-containing protein [Hydrogenobaculum sp.]
MIEFRVCPHDTQKGLDKWLNIAKKIKEIFGQEVELKPFKNFDEEYAYFSKDDFKPDIYYASFDMTLLLLDKGYKIIGKFKNENDVFLLVSRKKFNDEEPSNITIVDKLNSFYVLYDMDFYDKNIVLSEFYDDVVKKVISGEVELGLIFKEYYDQLDQETKDSINIVKEISLDAGHHFLVSKEFYETHQNSIKAFIKALELEEISEENTNKLKIYQKSGNIIRESVIRSMLVESLKDINQAIISADTEEELFERICQNLVNKSRFKFVWVGKKEGEFIKPVHKCGEDDGYVDSLKISVREDVPEGIGQTGIAYRENRIVINENTLTSDLMKAWKDELLKRDIYSSLAVPIEKNGEVYAVISVYSIIPFSFKKEFMTIFEELKKDVSFALEKIDKDKESIVLRKATDDAKMWLLITSKEGLIEYVNQHVLDLTGYKKEEVIGKSPKMFNSEYQSDNFCDEVWRTVSSNKPFSAIFAYKTKNENVIYIDQTIYPVVLNDGTMKFLFVGKDITNEKVLSQELDKYKFYDTLTELPNFLAFKFYVSDVVESKRYKDFALILIDIYNMSFVNSTYGFDVGNEVLKEVANILKQEFKEGFVARIGNDEFGIFVPDIESESILIYKIRSLLDRKIKTSKNYISISYNVSIVLSDVANTDFEEVYNNAVVTLNLSKKEGENVIKFYESEVNTRLQEYITSENLVERASEENLFRFYFQPYLNSKDLKIVGFESLIRIVDKDGTVYAPYKFIDYLENSKYIMHFEEWALKEISDKIRIFKSLDKDISISLNLSAKGILSLPDEDFIEKLASVPVDVQDNLVLEITERNIIKNVEKSKKIFRSIKEFNKHIKISIDDFGTGYSSLAYLKHLPIDILKIDISFIRGIATDRHDFSIVKFITGLSKDFGFKTIAEGVETKEQVDMLSSMGVDYFQGFYFAKPMPENEAIEFVLEDMKKSK